MTGRLALAAIAATLLLGACGSAPRPAPVSARGAEARPPAAKPPSAPEADWRPRHHVVRKGDTLYSIALDHGLDYRELAQWNGIANPDLIRVGQKLALAAPEETVTVTPLRPAGAPEAPPPVAAHAEAPALKSAPKATRLPYSEQALAQLSAVAPPAAPPPAPPRPSAVPPAAAATVAAPPSSPVDAADEAGSPSWAWPARGKLIGEFSESAKGIDIGGQLGQAVLASAPGKVVYSGTGLRGYGKLIIIKHNKDYLSAYAHNHRVLVKEGEAVTRGQKIAEMGSTDSEKVKLHFEIRRLGRPVDPLQYLPGGGPS